MAKMLRYKGKLYKEVVARSFSDRARIDAERDLKEIDKSLKKYEDGAYMLWESADVVGYSEYHDRLINAYEKLVPFLNNFYNEIKAVEKLIVTQKK